MFNIKSIEKVLHKNIKIYNILIFLIIIFGIYIRTKLLIYNPSLYRDEANLALNTIKHGYLNLFLPLDRLQVAPPLFCVFSKLVYSLFETFTSITTYTSDLAIKIVPYISGCLTVPAFGYLVWKIFKNRFITAAGLCAISAVPILITYSAIYKQYSTEALITILIMIITLHVNFTKNSIASLISKFVLLAITPFFSMTSLYILPFSFIYLLFRAKEKNCMSIYWKCLCAAFAVLFMYYLIFLRAVMSVHYTDMVNYWGPKVRMTSYEYYMRYALLAVLFSRKIKEMFLFGGPILLITLLVPFHKYPYMDRLLVFIIPLLIISFLYLIKALIRSDYGKLKTILLIPLIAYFVHMVMFQNPIETYRYRGELGREIWDTISKIDDLNYPVIASDSVNTNTYYSGLYNVPIIKPKKVFATDAWKVLPSGKYCMVITTLKGEHANNDIKKLMSRVGTDVEILDKHVVSKLSYYVIFNKLK